MIINGKIIATNIQLELQQKIASTQGRKPCLAMIIVGDHAPSQIYVRRKKEACQSIGIESRILRIPQYISEQDLLIEIDQLNQNSSVDGILIQLPLPAHINSVSVTSQITPKKDVDGLHPINAGKLLLGIKEGFVPCTPLGVQALLGYSGISIEGKHVVILGRSNLVGKPLAALLMQNAPQANASVTVLHSKSQNIEQICQTADILIAAIGQPQFVKASFIKKGAVVIDVGINKIEDNSNEVGYRIVGDVDFEQVKNLCSFITPVPGGVGPMTIAMLLSNTLKSYEQA